MTHEIVGFHRPGEAKTIQFIYRERESLRSALPLACKNLGVRNKYLALCNALTNPLDHIKYAITLLTGGKPPFFDFIRPGEVVLCSDKWKKDGT